MNNRYAEWAEQGRERTARMAHALASPRRLELIELLAQTERTVEELAWLTGQSVANTSRHLQVLRGVGAVEVRRQGPYGFYRLAEAGVYRAMESVAEAVGMGVVERSVTLLEESGVDVRGEIAEMSRRLGLGDLVVVDARPEEEFRTGHVAGSVSVPPARLESWAEQWVSELEVWVYGRGPKCALAAAAVELLRARGIRVRGLGVGLPAWAGGGARLEAG